jgi:NitT/TauT family transport system ATP-binding protein
MLVTHDLREAVFLADRVFVMSARPGRVIAEHRIGFGRPRDLAIMYEPAFNEKVHELRGQIAEARVVA